MKIFLTGATGFIGRNLVPRLVAQGYKVTALARDKKNQKRFLALGVESVLGDITKPEKFITKLNNSDLLIHLAAFRSKKGNRSQVFEVNANTFGKLITPQTKLRHIIIVSSVYVFGNLKKLPAREDAPLAAKDIYGLSKIALEKTVKKVSEKLRIPYTILRPAIVYGPGDSASGMVIKLIKLTNKKIMPMIGNGANLQHLVYVSDLVDAFILVIKKGGDNQTYIIAGAAPIKLIDLVKLINSELGKKSRIIRLPKEPVIILVTILEKVFDFLRQEQSPISLKSIENLTQDWYYDISKAQKELGFKSKVDYSKGVVETIKWYKTNSGLQSKT